MKIEEFTTIFREALNGKDWEIETSEKKIMKLLLKLGLIEKIEEYIKVKVPEKFIQIRKPRENSVAVKLKYSENLKKNRRNRNEST